MEQEFSPYFGAPEIMALQRKRDLQVAELKDLPGAVVHGRVFASDDPAKLGWHRLREAMAEDGVISLRGIDDATIEKALRELADFHPVLHHWDLFMADAQTIRAVCGPIIEDGAPDGVECLDGQDLTPKRAREVQAFLTGLGVSPFSTDALLGRLFPARLIAFQDARGRIVAAGFAAMTHNRHSPLFGSAWVGLIGVDAAYRGLGFGKYVDAIANLAAIEDLGGSSTMEFVARDNAPSRAMLKSCGLKQVPGKSVVMLSTSDVRLTK
ncbi:GNAT family N-acetyltransferase [Oceanomicrobium pacificus]|uniref:GNAT family N-acetyltransferase n=1 Tax=Oceanomicrobium pacificus TaxID=2692916 RepID=A0A6B0TYZ4_9RHOB|nr:GNAT family N-acetyltransferase [Oceanomicrobium pacificus]MXU66233.1 GNAT family N-acetyltransferase [Oceanomicrobium pacificus]